ncbi:hypothetical protein WMF30_10835 [Sorangium sp. So ce134]
MTMTVVYDEADMERSGPSAGLTARQEFGAQELARAADVGVAALAAQARAEVEARYVMALQRPRNWLNARAALLAECDRPGFAEVAWFRKPIGGGKTADGLSIRFAEAAHRAAGNIHVAKTVVYDDIEKRTVRVMATDLESNISESVDVTIEKTVERRSLKSGQKPLRSRVNSYGEVVHIVPGTEGEILTKQKAEVAKAKREVVLGLIPGDIIEECKRRILDTQERRDASDPQAAIKKICDAFAKIGVKPSDLEQFLGHRIDASSPAEIAKLRAAFVCVQDGEATWGEVLAAERGETPGGAKVDPRAAKLKEKLEAAGKKKPAGKGAAPPPPPPSQPSDEDQARAIDRGEDDRQPGEDDE